MRYYVVTGVAGASFATASRLTEIEAELAAFGAHDVTLEIVSGVLVSIGFSIEAETFEKARIRAEEVVWATSLERVGLLEIAEPATL